MSCPSWSTDEVLEFLDLYEKEHILWDPNHIRRTNKTEIVAAWNRIKSNLSVPCSIDDLKKKKESLMTRYRDQKKKTLKSAEWSSPWYFFPVMDNFLNEKYKTQYEPNKNLDNDCQEKFKICPSWDQTQGLHMTIHTRDQESPEDSVNDSSCSEPQDAIYHNTEPKTVKRKKRTISESSYPKNKIFKSVVVKSSPNQSDVNKMEDSDRLSNIFVDEKVSSEPDEYDLYGQLLVKKLRKLDEHQRDIVMHDIDTLMFRAKLKKHRTQLQITSSPIGKVNSPIFIVSPENVSNYEDESITYDEQL